MSRRPRPSIRLRLTALYAGAFLLGGAALVGLTYLSLRQALDHELNTRVGNAQRLAGEVLAEAHSGDSGQMAQLHEALRAQFEQDRDDTLRTMLIWSLAGLGLVGIGSGGLGWMLAGRALHPLQEVTATAHRVADRTLHERISLSGPDDEIKDLADTFDAMLERLDKAFDSQRRFVANASHELRTPLTINRALIDVALDRPNTPTATRELGTRLLEVNRRHEQLIDGLLVLASSDEQLSDRSPVDLAEVAEHAVTTSAAAADDAAITLRVTTGPAPVTGDPVLLERVVQNLLDNAIRYNLATGGRVSLTTGTEDGQARLTVRNTGPVVPEQEVEGLFEPFRRLDSADRPSEHDPALPGRGAGLGLSIVRAAVSAHGGTVDATAQPGGGLVVRVRIPAATRD